MERGTLLAGRYEVLERLGRGGMGEVWSARDRVLHRIIAVKLVVGEDVSGEVSARFEREAVAAAQVNHPNVASLYDRGAHGDKLFLVMELVDGMPLSSLIKAWGVLPLPRALELAEQICAALEATHAAGVVHYDIKPQNVMITAAGSAKVVDFGIAGLVQARQFSVVHSSRLTPVATFEYAAPEQFKAERGDARSDLYALGGVLFAMLTGHSPFTGHSVWAVIAAKTGSDAPRLDEVRPGLPPGLVDLVARLLEREAAQRPDSAREVRGQLAHFRADAGGDDPLLGPAASEEALAQVPISRAAARPTLAGQSTAGESGPRHLPADTGLFTGRDDELRALFDLAGRARTNGAPGTVVISAIDGMGGVGKTALAIRAAHHLAPRFPDGQLFLDLYGFTQGSSPREPGDALAALLGSLGVPPHQIPADLAARAACYRDRLAGTHTLVVLDNAADEAQVAPLLPASDTCLVLVTSRRQLRALDDALPLPLDVLPREEAVALLRKAARLDGHSGDRPLLEQAAELCGRLPLALLIAGALLRTGGKAWNLKVLIDRLKARRPGDELAGYTDETRNLPTVFDLSYQHLPEDLQVLYRRVGILPSPELDAHAAAALLDIAPPAAGRLLERLAGQSLLAGAAPGRYRLHDLIRAHAQTLAVRLDGEPDREAALGRLLHYYAHAAQSASISIARVPRPEPDGPAPAHAPALQDPDAARAWLRTEYPNLEAAFAHAHLHSLDRYTIALAAGLGEILQSDGPFTRGLEIHQAAAAVAGREQQPAARANALTDLGRVRFLTGDVLGAAEAVASAVEISREIGDRLGEAAALNTLGRVRYATGDFPEAVDAVAQAVDIYRRIGVRLGEAAALTTLGQVRFLTGDVLGAAEAVALAVEISREIGNRLGEAAALITLGRVRYATGDLPGAADAQVQALEISRQIGDRGDEAYALNRHAAITAAAGDDPRALALYQQALALNRELHRPDDEAISLEGIAEHYLATGDLVQATTYLRRALEIYRRLGMHVHIERVTTRLAGLATP